jgi:hypothetical protein
MLITNTLIISGQQWLKSACKEPSNVFKESKTDTGGSLRKEVLHNTGLNFEH